MKNTLQKLIFMLFFLIITALSRCNGCQEGTQEPRVNLDIRKTLTTPAFTKIYAQNANRASFESNQPITKDTVIQLPFNLNAQITKYILESAFRTDSITFSYDLEIDYTKKCGYYYKIKNLRFIENKSSFNNSQIIISGFFGSGIYGIELRN